MITLYYSPQSCSLIPHIYLRELNADYDLQLVSLKDGMHKKPEFLAINPKGKLPIIKHNDKVITETVAILLYIANLYPAPKDAQKTSDIWEWVSFFSTSLHVAFVRLFRPNYFTTGKENYPAVQELANKNIADIFTIINDILSQQSYLNGEDFQLCDISLFNYGRWGNLAKTPTKEYSNLADFMQRVAKKPSVADVLQTEGIGIYRDVFPVLN